MADILRKRKLTIFFFADRSALHSGVMVFNHTLLITFQLSLKLWPSTWLSNNTIKGLLIRSIMKSAHVRDWF